jgi:hypothetical protein
MRIEIRDAGEIVNEPKEQLWLVRQAPVRYRDTAHRELDDTHGHWSQQIDG